MRVIRFKLDLAAGLVLLLGAAACSHSGGALPPAGLTYATSTAVYTQGQAITADLPSSLQGTPQSYSVAPALPAGLVLSPTTGIISGTPTPVAAAAPYLVTASNAAGATTASLSIEVDAGAPAGLAYGTRAASYVLGAPIANNLPSSTGGAPTAYSVVPPLPAGLSLDAATGIIGGTPTAVTATAGYLVTASNAAGSAKVPLVITVTSAPVAPAITTAPSPQSVTVGDAVAFTVSATGTAPLSYQWYQGTTPVGGNAPFYTIASAQPADAGSYTVTVSNGTAPAAASGAAALTVSPVVVAPVITTYPASQSVVVGNAAAFSVAATGSSPLNYQWHQGGVNVGTDSASYSSNSAQGSYPVTVTVSNAAGSVTSNIATLAVTLAPAAPTIATAPSPQSVTVGDAVTFTVTANGTAPLSYQWYQGTTPVGGNAPFYAIGSAQPANAGTYTVTVSNGTAPAATSGAAALTVNPAAVAPTISTAPGSQTVTEGQPASFTVTATGSAPLSYVWQQNGINVGSDASTYALALPLLTDAGSSITVTVTNGAGSATSSAATLTVNPLLVTLGSSMPLNLTPIAAGTFTMGSPASDPDHMPGEAQHQVTLSQNFYMGTYPVTQWQQIMGSNPSHFSTAGGGSGTNDLQRPVETVNYADITTAATGFLALLNQNAAVTPAIPPGYGFRLPTEAEWEYACRAGTTTRFYWGAFPDTDTTIDSYAWYSSNDGSTSEPVGGLLPNAWGLYDMAGNVLQWCQDWYGSYDTGPDTDPTGPANGLGMVTRGGYWSLGSFYCRSAYREAYNPTYRGGAVGFRVVLAPTN